MTIATDRVKETTTSTGTGNITLGGAPTGFQTFAAGLTVGTTFCYTIAGGSEWEVGLGSLSDATTLVRTTVLSSSTGVLVNFSAGTKDVFNTLSGKQITEVAFALLAEATIAGQRTALGLGTLATQSGTYGNVLAADAAADTTTWVLLAPNQTGDQQPRTDANFIFDASTNTLGVDNITGTALGMTIQPKVPGVLDTGLALTLKTPNAAKPNTSAGGVNITGGTGNGSGDGGLVIITAGAGGASGNGGTLTLNSGNGAFSGGGLNLNAGNAANGFGGSIFFTSGSASGDSSQGGGITLNCGGADGDNSTGGSGQFVGGAAQGPSGSIFAGGFEFTAGSCVGTGPSADLYGGNIVFRLAFTGGTYASRTFGAISFQDAASASILSLTEDGTNQLVGFFGATPKARAAAYTKTYSTASRTIPNATFTNLSTTAATNVVPWGFSTQAQADQIATRVNALAADVLILKQLIVSLVNDSSATLGVGLNAT